MTIALAQDVEVFLQEQVKSGACKDPSELVNDALRAIREQQNKPFQMTPELEAWLLESSDKPLTPLTTADFEGIRKRLQARTPRSAS
jgi:Arc/MetJ-type ribon-helix-helix transcriptional regulator